MKENVVYLRTSTEEQTPENQLNDVISLIDTEDYEVIIEKQSAWKDDVRARPKFNEIYKAVQQGKINKLYVWDFDRIYRNRAKFVYFWSLCKMNKVEIVSFRQNVLSKVNNLDEPFKSIIESIIVELTSWMAEDESKKKSERVKIAFKNHKGKKWGRPKLKVNVYEIKKLRSEGKSIREISTITGINRNKVHKIVSQ